MPGFCIKTTKSGLCTWKIISLQEGKDEQIKYPLLLFLFHERFLTAKSFHPKLEEKQMRFCHRLLHLYVLNNTRMWSEIPLSIRTQFGRFHS